MERGGGSRFASLVPILDRYGDAIEADLHETFGVDLLDFFRGVHPWRKLDNFIKRLGSRSTSEFFAALANDESQVKDLPDEVFKATYAPQPPALTEYTAEVRRMDALIYLVGELITATAGSGTAPKPPQGPMTAFQREKDRRSQRRLDALEAEVLGAVGTLL